MAEQSADRAADDGTLGARTAAAFTGNSRAVHTCDSKNHGHDQKKHFFINTPP
jgi:hypothetical protein